MTQYDDQISERISSIDDQIQQLRRDMRTDIQRIEARLGSGFTRLQWWLIGILGSIIIGLLSVILQAV